METQVRDGLEGGEAPGFRDLDLKIGYDTADEALRHFYVPVLERAVHYDRSVGYFRASALSVAARGMSRFVAGGGTARFLVGAELGERERDALRGATEVPAELAARLADELVPPDELDRRRLEVLAWLVREGRLELRVVVAVDEQDTPVPPGAEVPYFHEKVGVLRDRRGDGIAFQGSVNESASGWSHNFESFSVYRSWAKSAEYFDNWTAKFEERWAGTVPGFRVFPLPQAVEAALVAYAPPEAPVGRDPEEPPAASDAATTARFLRVAPRLDGADAMGEATAAVKSFPHQRKVSERLAAEYPKSWLVADEVGLGKTISAGLALRRLLLGDLIQRVLILAPAHVCRQWQDELFEKFGLWVPRLEGGAFHGAHPDDVRPVAPGTNPYAEEPVLLVSSHLARRVPHQDRILAAPRFDLIVVDEAHHARRRAADVDEYRPSRLLGLLDRIQNAGHTDALWLLTATPMQMHPIELWDLLRHVGLPRVFENSFEVFDRFYRELAKDDDATDWSYLHRTLASEQVLPSVADEAMGERIREAVGIVASERIRRFGQPGEDPGSLVDALDGRARGHLRAWVRHRSPVGQLVTRHTRDTLRRYRDEGILHEPIADRTVEAVSVPFSPREQELYDGLDRLIDRLHAAHGERRGVGFVLTVYRRRLTSSWEAIRRTLQRRLSRDELALDENLLEELDDEDELDTGEGRTVDDTQIVPLSDADVAEVEHYLSDLDRVPDSKFDRLRQDLDRVRAEGRPVIVFTQFTDTLDDLRDKLHSSYRSHLATYSGSGGRIFLEDEGWTDVSKQALVQALAAGRISVILATDAASEGLNLQRASAVINYDLPWNPMRVEQRIGRIDRIGQPAPTIDIRNYVIPETVEESVYRALATRIDLFYGLVGRLQPILGATEKAFRSVFETPRAEREGTLQREVAELMRRVDELEASGVDLTDEDPLPVPEHPPPPVTLPELEDALDRLEVRLDSPGRPATFDPTQVSRDPEQWNALATYGHPRLVPELQRLAQHHGSDGPLVISEFGPRAAAYRADRTPPERVQRLADLADLGPPVATGDATTRAQADAAEAARLIKARTEALRASRRSKWEQDVKRRFRILVARGIHAEQLLHRHHDGDEPDAQLVWLELTGDRRHRGWASADNFRQHLRMEIADLLPGPPGSDDRSDQQLRTVRARVDRDLQALILEWMNVTSPEAELSTGPPHLRDHL